MPIIPLPPPITDLSAIPVSIREQIIVALEALLQLPGVTVHRERTRPLEKESLPAIVLYCDDEDPHAIGSQYKAPLSEQELNIHFEARALGSEAVPVDQALDPLLTWINRQVFNNEQLGGLANGAFQKRTVWFSKEGDQAIASAVRTIGIRYRTSRLDPTSKT